MGLYTYYYLTVRDNPGYSFTDFDLYKSTLSKAVYSMTFVVITLYVSFYMTALIVNCKNIL